MKCSLRSPSVILVSLPWTTLTEPSLGLGILRGVLDQKEITCRILHLNLFLLEHLRSQSYYALANVFALNDFLFSGVLDPTISRRQQQWLRMKSKELLSYKLINEEQYGGLDGVVEQLLKLRHEVIPVWLTRWADEIAKSDATLIGLTCMFDQTIASLALAHLVKQRSPEKLISLGGYAVRSPTGEAILRSFPCVDVVCIGEGELVIEALARASTGETSLANVPGILYRRADQSIHATEVPPLVDMNSVPVPNYDDFFVDLDTLSNVYKIDVDVNYLPIDNSRGCWWGQKRHCVFCGIHEDDLVYRFRDAERVIEVMDALFERYEVRRFRFTDYILPHQYFETLLPELARRNRPYSITSEMKSNINAERFALLAAAGIDEVQPGIESFSSGVLRKMDKGVSAIQNVYTLLLGKRNGVMVHYNLLYGLPNDSPEEVSTIVRLLPRLVHLDPPSTRLQIQVTRFAPLQTTPERFGIPQSKYEPSYNLIFSSDFLAKTKFDLNDFCYYFDRPFENSRRLRRLYAEIDRIVDAWKSEQEQREVSLWYKQVAEEIEVFDSRSDTSNVIRLTTDEASVYLSTIEPIAIETLRRRCCESMEYEFFLQAFKRLDSLGIIFQESEHVIGLALPKL